MTAFGEVIDLSHDTLTINAPSDVRRAAKAALDEGQTHYTDRPGVMALREAVALKLAEHNGIHVAPADEVLITCGAQEALFLTLRILVAPGTEVIIPGPALPSDREIIRLFGGAARVAPSSDELEVDIDEVEALMTPDTGLILLRSPSPVGQVIPESAIERLGELALRNHLRMIAVERDEVLSAPGQLHRSIGSIAGMAPLTVTINDFSFAGLDGWRVGYLAAQRETLGAIRGLKQELSICSPAVSQYAALAGMGQLGGYLAALRDRLDTRRSALTAKLVAEGLTHNDPQSGIYVMVSCGGRSTADVMSRVAEAGVLVADGARIGAAGWLRLTLDHDASVLREAAQRLTVAVRQLAGEVSQ